jgi:hypothetical protein
MTEIASRGGVSLWLVVFMLQAVYLFLSTSCVVAQAVSQLTDQCRPEDKNRYYKEFIAASESLADETKALEAARKYLSCPLGSDESQEVLAKMNLAVGRILRSKNQDTASIQYFIKAIAYKATVKTSPETYADLAHAYEDGPYAVMADDYRARFTGKDDSPEGRQSLLKIYPIVDCMIDAYARAVALARTAVPARPPVHRLQGRTGHNPNDWMEDLIALYTFRKHRYSSSDLKRYIGSVLSTPLPPNPRSSQSKLGGLSRRGSKCVAPVEVGVGAAA